MRTRIGKALVLCGLLPALAGCAHGSDRSPEELLSLSVSGLSGVDRYAFSGDTGIGIGNRTANDPAAFHGTVENHEQVSVKETAASALSSPMHPLQLLNRIEASAAKTELVPEESDGERLVLRITADPNKAAANWAERLRNEFGALEKKMPSGYVAKWQSRQSRSAAEQNALQEEWTRELAKSKQKLDAMLATMQVQSTCTLVIDRKKLLPLSLEERTRFRYETDGGPAAENRRTRMAFKRLDGRNM